MDDAIETALRRALYWFTNERAHSFLRWWVTTTMMLLGGVVTLVLWFIAVLYSGVIITTETWEPVWMQTALVNVKITWVSETLLTRVVATFGPIVWLTIVVIPFEWLLGKRYGGRMVTLAEQLSYGVFRAILVVVTSWCWLMFLGQELERRARWSVIEAELALSRWKTRRVLAGLPLPGAILRIVAPKMVLPLLAASLTPIAWFGAGPIMGATWLALAVAMAVVDSVNVYEEELRFRRAVLG